MAKIKLTEPVLTIKGEPFINGEKELTYQDMIIELLSAPKEKDGKKLDKYKLAMKCLADEPDLSVDDRKLIKDVANDSNINPIIYGRLHDLMEND